MGETGLKLSLDADGGQFRIEFTDAYGDVLRFDESGARMLYAYMDGENIAFNPDDARALAEALNRWAQANEQ